MELFAIVIAQPAFFIIRKKLQQLHSECTLCQRHITFVVNHVMVLSSFSIDSTRTTCEGVWHRFSVKLLWQDCKSAFLVSERMHYIQLNGWKKTFGIFVTMVPLDMLEARFSQVHLSYRATNCCVVISKHVDTIWELTRWHLVQKAIKSHLRKWCFCYSLITKENDPT